ncbi:ECF-type sigma factor [Planctomyces sp. SH-PL14]|uniref:ECF-type sigma factor n=1 Tax=Planctomyces sp. SH-PL14 TaxID=1632864 RepID=UPI00078E0B79|nr:ECF-type sigma factor [Planctomyces sp. SH-PL14]AMV20685.1 ECF sigma factor [Planctomyces sp. SH-PL14]
MSDVTRILSSIEQGDRRAAGELLPLVYDELRRLAAARLLREPPGQSVQPTMLVHEAYLRLVDADAAPHWNSRGHFFAAAAEAMRRILIENARRKRSERHGGQMRRVDLETVDPGAREREDELLDLDEALGRLEERWPEKAQLVKLRYFVGMTIPEAAETMGISHATAERHWTFARAWLHAQIRKDG